MENKFKFIFLMVVVVMLFSGKAIASLLIDVSSFRQIVVLENGRIKPMDTYAQNFLLQLSGRKTFDKEPAYKWMAKFLFTPYATSDDKVFLIDNPAIAESLNISVEKKRRYSFAQIEPSLSLLREMVQSVLEIDEKERDLVEQEIIRLYENIQYYSKVSLTMAFAFDHVAFTLKNPQLKAKLGLMPNQTQFAFIDFVTQAAALKNTSKYLETKPKASWNQNDRELISIMRTLFDWSVAYTNLPLKIIPPFHEKDTQWYAPWDIMSDAMRDSEGRNEIILLSEMTKSYRNDNQVQFNLSVKKFIVSVQSRAIRFNFGEIKRIQLELQFNQLNAFLWARIAYLISFFLFLMYQIKSHKFVRSAGTILLWSGGVLHAIGMIYRMIILQRPPVSTLYETFVFVAIICVILGAIIEIIHKRWIGYCIAAIGGWVFLTIAHKFSMEGDTFQQLVAVLNSNFWLSTHVLSITIGYGATCVAGLIGHIYLIQVCADPTNKKQLRETTNILIGSLGFALIATFIGTNLGGIWADQSWGRFWGWDPKENGALLIVLWIVIVLHARIAKIIGPLGLAIASTMSIMIVVWAWFGVNLLSVGLHSYGFTSGLARNLMFYYAIHTVIIIIQTLIAKNKLSTVT